MPMRWMSGDFTDLPSDLPVPEDDGAADHLAGMEVPALRLPSTGGQTADLAELSREDASSPTSIRGPASRRALADRLGRHTRRPWLHTPELRLPRRPRRLRTLGATVVGISAQSPAEQRSSPRASTSRSSCSATPSLALAEQLRLPTFEVDGMTLYRRLTLVAEADRIVKVFSPRLPARTRRERPPSACSTWLRDGSLTQNGGGGNRTHVRGRSAKVSTGIAGA